MQGLSGEDKRLGSLIDPIVELMIKEDIMAYCIQETRIVGNKKNVGSRTYGLHAQQGEKSRRDKRKDTGWSSDNSVSIGGRSLEGGRIKVSNKRPCWTQNTSADI